MYPLSFTSKSMFIKNGSFERLVVLKESFYAEGIFYLNVQIVYHSTNDSVFFLEIHRKKKNKTTRSIFFFFFTTPSCGNLTGRFTDMHWKPHLTQKPVSLTQRKTLRMDYYNNCNYVL